MDAAASHTPDPVSQHQPDHRGGVFEKCGLHRGVRAALHVFDKPGTVAPGLAPHLRVRPDERYALGDAGQGERDVGDEEIAAALVPEREYPFEYRESAASDEDTEGREQRPEVAFLAVSERVAGIGGPLAPVHRRQQERLVEGVGGRVRGLGQHGTRAGEKPSRQLDDADEDIRHPRHDDRAPGLSRRGRRLLLPGFPLSGFPLPVGHAVSCLCVPACSRSSAPAGFCP
jgi:hypothetical protein